MKKVFSSNSECIHVFAQRKQSEGRANSVFFYGDKLYSYGYHFTLATFVNDYVVLLNDIRYSNSTSRHQAICLQAFRQYTTIYESQHNIELVVSELKNLKKLLLKARKPEKYLNKALNLIKAHKTAQSIYPNVCNQIEAIKDLSELTDFFDMQTESLSEYIAKAKKQEQERTEKYTLLFKNAFYAYEPYVEYKNKAHLNCDLVRLSECETMLETSQNVKVSVSDAKALLRAHKAGIDVTGKTISHYEIRSISNDRVLIGCHNLKLSDIERVLK
jgi:hypothetical protein